MAPARSRTQPLKDPAPTPSRRGRPPTHEAGQAEERVLEAATALFLEQGFGRTTLDQVAARAHVGKSSLYGRHPDKEALFGAVVHHSILTMFAEMATLPEHGDVADRLLGVGVALAESLLVPRCVALMRITAAEAATLPDLARMAYRVSFEGAVKSVRAVLDREPGLASDGSKAAAARFVEVALQPIAFQAAFGGDVGALRERCSADVADAILLLRAKGLLPTR